MFLTHLSNTFLLKGKYEDAESLYRLAVKITEATLGKDHPGFIHPEQPGHAYGNASEDKGIWLCPWVLTRRM